MYRTSDAPLIATLKYCGFHHTDTERQGKRIFFLYHDEKRVKEIAENYYKGKIEVNPERWFMEFRNMKNYINNESR